MPSSSFLMMFLLFDIYKNDSSLIHYLDREHHTILIAIVFIVFTGLSTLLTILHQFFYDNWIKENYDPIYLFKNEKEELEILREDVIDKLKKEDATFKEKKLTDYLLYQILGKKAKERGEDIKTTRYVDDVKTIGIFFVSLLLMITIAISKYFLNVGTLLTLKNIFLVIGGAVALLILYKIGKELILSKYRSRAVRIYTNFLNEKER